MSNLTRRERYEYHLWTLAYGKPTSYCACGYPLHTSDCDQCHMCGASYDATLIGAWTQQGRPAVSSDHPLRGFMPYTTHDHLVPRKENA